VRKAAKVFYFLGERINGKGSEVFTMFRKIDDAIASMFFCIDQNCKIFKSAVIVNIFSIMHLLSVSTYDLKGILSSDL